MNSFSIIVPVYNVEEYLEKCLDSLVNQKYNNYEIIIVNDGSSDNSEKIIEKYKNKYKKLIKSYNKKNGGLSSARNYGIKKSTKEYLLFVDSDDYIELNTLEVLNKELLKNNSDIIVFNYNAIYKNYNVVINTFNNNIKDISKKYLIGNPSACNKLVKKELLIKNKIEFPEGLYYEDLATTPKFIKYTKNISFINEALYNYLVRDNSITNKSNYNKKMDDIFKVCKSIKEELNNKYFEEVEYIYIEHLLRNASLRFISYKKYEKVKEIRNIIKKDFPKWNKNKYYKNYYSKKQKIMCNLIMNKMYFIINLIKIIKVGK